MDLKELKMSKDINEHTFGQYLREKRETLGKSVRGFAEELGMTAAYLSDIEKGNRYAPRKYLDKFIEAFGISEEEKEIFEDLAAEQKARTTYENLIRIIDDPDVLEPLKFLREREVVHFQRFGEALEKTKLKLDEKNFYYFNAEFDKQFMNN